VLAEQAVQRRGQEDVLHRLRIPSRLKAAGSRDVNLQGREMNKCCGRQLKSD
jgi:hypothetical protein